MPPLNYNIAANCYKSAFKIKLKKEIINVLAFLSGTTTCFGLHAVTCICLLIKNSIPSAQKLSNR